MSRRHWYFVTSFSLSLLALIYCFQVYRAGQFGRLEIGANYLSGIPNYYFFYTIILPFVAAGVIYLARENFHVRLFGKLSKDLDKESRSKVLIMRRVFFVVAILFSLLLTLQDAANKTTALPPYSIDLGNAAANEEIAHFFACERGWEVGDCGATHAQEAKLGLYLEELQGLGFAGQSASGFDSFAHWRAQSSSAYLFESILSFIAALIMSLLFAQVFLLIIVKEYVKPATKSLVIWMVVLASLWFPTKMYSTWYSDFETRMTSSIFWVGIVVLAIAVFLVIFLKTERNDFSKFSSIVGTLVSATGTIIGVLEPEIMKQAVAIMREAGLVYTSIVAVILMTSLYLVTDNFISNYEKESANKS